MSRITRVAVLAVSLMSLFAVLASAAGAVTWHNSGDTAFTATGGAGTLTVTSATLTCATGSATGTMAPTNFVGAVWKAAHGNITFSTCANAGVPTHVECTYDLTATATTNGGTTIQGAIDAACTVTQFGASVCTLNGQVTGYYENANQAGNTFGRIVSTTGHIRTGASCISALGGANEPSTLSTQNFVITSATGGNGMGPVVTRTA